MPQCKYCKKEVVWVVKEDGKNRPYNAADLTPHDCPEGQAARGSGNKGGYSGPRSDPVVIARQSMVKVASDIVLSGANASTQPTDVITEDIINIARILVKFVQEG